MSINFSLLFMLLPSEREIPKNGGGRVRPTPIFRVSSYKQQSNCAFMIVSQQRGKVKATKPKSPDFENSTTGVVGLRIYFYGYPSAPDVSTGRLASRKALMASRRALPGSSTIPRISFNLPPKSLTVSTACSRSVTLLSSSKPL